MVHFMVRKEGRQEPEWSSDYSFLIPLSGTVKLFLKKKILELKKGDVVMIEPFQYFSLSDVSGSCLLCGVALTKLMSGQGAAPGRLECNSVMELHKVSRSNLRYLTSSAGDTAGKCVCICP